MTETPDPVNSDVVYVVMHVHEFEDDTEDMKMIGVFSTEEHAQQAIEPLRTQPGFKDHPDGFSSDEFRLNDLHWAEGFFTYHYPKGGGP